MGLDLTKKINRIVVDGEEAIVVGTPTLQDKEVVPSKEPQIVSADSEFDAIKTVTVLPIPDEYIVPKGSLEVTENDTYDVRSLAEIIVNVEGSGGGASTPHPELPYSKYINPDWWDIKTILDEDTGYAGLPSGYTYKVIMLLDAVRSSYSGSGSYYYKTCEGKTGKSNTVSFDGSNDKPYYNDKGDIIGYTRYVIFYFNSATSISAYKFAEVNDLKYMEGNYNVTFPTSTSTAANDYTPLCYFANLEILQYAIANCKIASASGNYISADKLKYLAPFTTAVTSPDFSWTANINNVTQLKTVDMSNLQYSKTITFAENRTIEEIRNVNLNKGYGLTLTNCRDLRFLQVKNIKVNLTIGSKNTYGHLIVKDCLINIIKELIDTGSAKTLTMGTYNTPKIANVYVKLLEDDGSGKLPCEVCESTDEGAMTITDYAGLKNWAIA